MSVQRIFGLSGSGVDVDSIVTKLMQAQRMQYSSLYQKRDWLTWEKAAYNDVYNSLTGFRTTVSNYQLSSALTIKAVSSGNTSIATATANAAAANISHTLNVTQLASGVRLTSSASITPTGATKDTLTNQFYGGISPGTFNLKITNGSSTATIAVDPTKSIYDLVGQINKANINVTANYDSTLDRFFLYTTNTGSTTGISFAGSDPNGISLMASKLKVDTGTPVSTAGVTSTSAVTGISNPPVNVDPAQTLATLFGTTGSFNLRIANGASTATVLINSTDTLNTVINNINNAAGVNASASYDQGTGLFNLKALSGSLDLTGSDAGAMSFLRNDLKLNAGFQTGTDAKFTLDNVALTQSSNTFTISGVTYNLTGTGATTVNVTTDLDKSVASVQAFVDAYNKTLDSLNAKLSEPRYQDYQPLTADQKAAMKDSEITAWEAKAKSGLLRNDSILQNLVFGMRNAIISPVSGQSGTYTSAASIGITTGTYTEQGHLYFDPDKLRTALTADPNALQKIFGTSGNASDSQNGIATRLNTLLTNANIQITTKAGFSPDPNDISLLGQQIYEYNTNISDAEKRLQDLEDRYYQQFTAMEEAIKQMNSQSAWLQSQLGMGR